MKVNDEVKHTPLSNHKQT